MNIRSKNGKRSVELHAAERRALDKSESLCNELAALAGDPDAKQARVHLLNVIERYKVAEPQSSEEAGASK